MAIERLNFSGASSGSGSTNTSLGTLSDRLIKYGSMLNDQDAEREKLKMQQDQIAYGKERDLLQDTRYNEDKRLQAEEKARLLGKEYNTAKAAMALTDPETLKKEALAGEQKAIQETIANATPELKLQIQQELKGYDPAKSGQQWVDTALGQSNVDTNMLTNLKRDIVKQAADEKYRDESIALQKRQNEIVAGARADALKYQRDELQFKKDQLLKPELSAKQKEFKGNLALFGNDEEKAGIATFGSDEWKKIKGTYQDESKKKEYAVGGISDASSKFIEEAVRTGDVPLVGGTWTKEGTQAEAAKVKTTLDNMQRAFRLPNSEMDRIIPLIVGNNGEINKDALDSLYGNKVMVDEQGRQIKMSDAFTKIANNPDEFITKVEKGKEMLIPINSKIGLETIAGMGQEEIESRGLTDKYNALKLKDLQDKVSSGKATQEEKNKLDSVIKPSEPVKDALEKKIIRQQDAPPSINKYEEEQKLKRQLVEEQTKESIKSIITNPFKGAEISKQEAKQVEIANKIKTGVPLTSNEKIWVDSMKNSNNRYDKFRLKELGIE